MLFHFLFVNIFFAIVVYLLNFLHLYRLVVPGSYGGSRLVDRRGGRLQCDFYIKFFRSLRFIRFSVSVYLFILSHIPHIFHHFYFDSKILFRHYSKSTSLFFSRIFLVVIYPRLDVRFWETSHYNNWRFFEWCLAKIFVDTLEDVKYPWK